MKSIRVNFLKIPDPTKKVKDKKKVLLIGSTMAVVSGGVALYNNYGASASAALTSAQMAELDDLRPQFLSVSTSIGNPTDEIKSIIPLHLRKHWRLMNKANVGGFETHLNAVRELSQSTSHLSDAEARQMAQCIKIHTAVGLARIPESDLRLFLPPVPLPREVRDTSIPSQFWTILSKLPTSKDLPECIYRNTTTALQGYIQQFEDDFVDETDLDEEFHRDTHLMMQIPARNRFSIAQVLEYSLIAILSHSTLQSHCQILAQQTNLLPLLIRIAQEYPNHLRLRSLIGKILANMSLFPETHEIIFASGWVGLLAEWNRDSNLLVSLPASKALSNLDQKYGQCKFAPGIYLMSPNDRVVKHKNERSNQGVDVVFIHGLLGGVFFTWRQHDKAKQRDWSDLRLVGDQSYTYCWPRDWLSQDGLDDRVRVIGVDFDSYISQWGNSCPEESFKNNLADRSKEILDKLRQCGVGQRPVIFVGHSMGGLVAKKIIIQAQAEQDHDLVDNAKGMMFFGTPHLGSSVAKLNSATKFFFFPSTEVNDLEENSPQLVDLNQNFKNLVKDKSDLRIISFGESFGTPAMFGIDMMFVSPESANLGIGEHYQLKANHLNVCKPDSKESIIYRRFIDLVMDVIDDNVLYKC